MKFDVKGIDKDILINLFQNMLKSRMIEEKMIILLRQGKVSKWFSGIGQDAIAKIKQCEQNDILSVTSFLEESISKVYITDLIQNFCMFNYEIVTLIDKQTSNLSCVYRGKQRVDRKLN